MHCEDPDPPDMVRGLQVVVTPDGDEEVVRLTEPVNPLLPEIVVVNVPVAPETKETLDGLVAMLKSGWPEILQAVTGWISQPLKL